ncbi:GNAT family N-acetyltransferase [Macrococcus animalis]|uniref:GNAT family N-acetyltransferase n=1 Tax=Macrococcus animalis TaxID=3395467 RepID=UPI0039BDF1EE
MYIKAERLVIRNFKASDIDDVYQIYKNEETCKYLLHDAWDESNKEVNFNNLLIKSDLENDYAINLAVSLNNKVIGVFHAWYTEMKQTIVVGFSFSNEFSGKGYATETLLAMLEYIFNNYEVHRIQAVCDDRNIASKKLCLRVGMRKEAHFIKDYWNKGEWTSSYVFGILKEELRTYEKDNTVIRKNPFYLSSPLGPYSQLTEVSSNKKILVTSGQVGCDVLGNIPVGLDEQVENCLKNIQQILENEDIDPSNVLKVNIYATEKLNWNYFNSNWNLIFSENNPAMTFVYVPALAMPELKIEIEIWCIK